MNNRLILLFITLVFFSCNQKKSKEWEKYSVLIDSSLTKNHRKVWGIRHIENIKKTIIEKTGGRSESGLPKGLNDTIIISRDVPDSLLKETLWQIEYVINTMNLHTHAVKWYFNENQKPPEEYVHFIKYDSLYVDSLLNNTLINNLIVLSECQKIIAGYYDETMFKDSQLSIDEYLNYKSNVLVEKSYVDSLFNYLKINSSNISTCLNAIQDAYDKLDSIETLLIDKAGGIDEHKYEIPKGHNFKLVDSLLLGRRKLGTRLGFEYVVALDNAVHEVNSFIEASYGEQFRRCFPSLTLDGKEDPAYLNSTRMKNMSFLQLQFLSTPVYVALKKIEYKKMQLLKMKKEVLSIVTKNGDI